MKRLLAQLPVPRLPTVARHICTCLTEKRNKNVLSMFYFRESISRNASTSASLRASCSRSSSRWPVMSVRERSRSEMRSSRFCLYLRAAMVFFWRFIITCESSSPWSCSIGVGSLPRRRDEEPLFVLTGESWVWYLDVPACGIVSGTAAPEDSDRISAAPSMVPVSCGTTRCCWEVPGMML